MGRFDIERLLRDLGEPSADAPKEPAAGGERVPDAVGEASLVRPETSSVTPAQPAPAPKATATDVRPPDFNTGAGLDAEIDPAMAIEHDRVRPTRPDDALRDLFVPDRDSTTGNGDLIDLLHGRDQLDGGSRDTARRLQAQTPDRSIASILLEMEIDESIVQRGVAEIARIDFAKVDVDTIDATQMKRLGVDYCLEHRVIPLRTEGTRTVIGTTSPDDVFLLDELKRRLGVSVVKHVLVCGGEVVDAIRTIEGGDDQPSTDIEAILADVEEDDVEFEKTEESETDLELEAESSPVVRYVNHIIQTALQEGASDIHIEPGEKHLKVRLRIDGILYEAMTPPKKMHAALTSRLKIMANLDIAERRLPQDGRIRATVMNRRLDLRLSTVPTANGEKTVMRILDDQAIQVSLDELGFSEDTLTLWKSQIDQPHGIILVTGPTGSGKTTTLYSSLRQMDMKRLNISTVEDPVEYNLPGVTQIQTHAMIDMTFARALKALLRQDPDVVMVGEIRDHETASIAVQAALTGHLVLSTLHTNDAPSSVTRLVNIGVEPFLVGAALNGVLAQRLVRRICPSCVEDMPVPEEMRDFLVVHGIDGATLPQGRGCEACRNSGYSGRLGLYELLVFDDHLRDLIASSPNVTEFRRICCERGMVSLREDGFRKVIEGRTTVEEVLRVTEATI
ncbi:MAG: GspE/PulE family protein [Phycisphaerales bacterium]|nr:GspE/PulE family protein [Phycisphaerales bacterium]MDG1978707.1 GspE/PulE family protein [Phycisphaerales bacterium]MDG2132809.1 GspE/PulE family protein [Phycisphaerales bacterium]